MAEKIINTRIKQRYGTLAEWTQIWSTFKPLQGEVCVFAIPANTAVTGLPTSTVLRHATKTGNGSTTLQSLPWDSALSQITVTTTDDNIVNLTSSGGDNQVTINASHASKGPSSGYTSSNSITSISGAGTSKTIKIPQLTVDTYGHVTSASDESITITLPSAPSLAHTHKITAAGTVASTFTGKAFSITPTFTGTETTISSSYTPKGSVSAPTITVTPNTTSIYSITGVGSLPSCTLPTLTCSAYDATNQSISLSWSAGSFSAGSLPSRSGAITVATGIKSASATAPTFTGTAGTATATYTPEGNISAVSHTPSGDITSTFTGTEVTTGAANY